MSVFILQYRKFSITFSSINFWIFFPRLISARTGTTHQGIYKVKPNSMSLWARGKLNLLIESQHIHKIKFQHENHWPQAPYQYGPSYHILLLYGHLYQEQITASFFAISTDFSLLDSIEGFLFHCKPTILQPSHAVSGLKDVPKEFWRKQEVFLTHSLFGV